MGIEALVTCSITVTLPGITSTRVALGRLGVLAGLLEKENCLVSTVLIHPTEPMHVQRPTPEPSPLAPPTAEEDSATREQVEATVPAQDGAPAKRGRGRPRRAPEAEAPAAATEAEAPAAAPEAPPQGVQERLPIDEKPAPAPAAAPAAAPAKAAAPAAPAAGNTPNHDTVRAALREFSTTFGTTEMMKVLKKYGSNVSSIPAAKLPEVLAEIDAARQALADIAL